MSHDLAALPGPRYFDAAVETLPGPSLRALQTEKLLAQLPHIVERSAFHGRLWKAVGVRPADIHSLDDFVSRAPMFDAHTLRDHAAAVEDGPYCLWLVPSDAPDVEGFRPVRGAVTDPTVGVTGFPPTRMSLARNWWEMGVRRGDYVFYSARTADGDGMIDTFRHLGATILPVGAEPEALLDVATFSRGLHPSMLYGLSARRLDAILQQSAERGVDPVELFASVRAMVFTEGGLTPGRRATVAEWGVELFDTARLGGVGMAVECRAHDGMHVWEDGTFIEVVDPASGTPVAPGTRGELVVTSLDDPLAPRLRFRTGDLVELLAPPCACARTHARLRWLGARADQARTTPT